MRGTVLSKPCFYQLVEQHYLAFVSQLSNDCPYLSTISVDLGEKGVYSSYTRAHQVVVALYEIVE